MCWPERAPPDFVQHRVIQFVAPRRITPGCTHGVTSFTPRPKDASYMSTDPLSASIIPFEVPEQVRAFAEKGVSQAREGYAKFKDAAEAHNGTIEAVFTSANKGAS